MELRQLQAEVAQWTTKNFGAEAPSYLALIKVQEELGELAGAYMGRMERRVGKSYTDQQEKVRHEVADIVIALTVFCVREKLPLEHVVEEVWCEVRQRTFNQPAQPPATPSAK